MWWILGHATPISFYEGPSAPAARSSVSRHLSAATPPGTASAARSCLPQGSALPRAVPIQCLVVRTTLKGHSSYKAPQEVISSCYWACITAQLLLLYPLASGPSFPQASLLRAIPDAHPPCRSTLQSLLPGESTCEPQQEESKLASSARGGEDCGHCPTNR